MAFNVLRMKSFNELSERLPKGVNITFVETVKVEDNMIMFNVTFWVDGTIYKDTMVYKEMPTNSMVMLDTLVALTYFLKEHADVT